MNRSNTRNRSGFTLIELLVVIAIIITLTSLLLAAVFKALNAGKNLQERRDITDLHQAVAAFKAHFGLEYMPSKVVLSGGPSGDAESDSIISRMFPNKGFHTKWQGGGIVWSDQAGGGTLYGNECLVFFLGGPQRGGRPTGWSLNPNDPTDQNGERKMFFEFRKERLKAFQGSQWLSFWNPEMKQPYAYFSKRISPNTYDPGDCQSLGLLPYGNSQTGYVNEDSYQIIGPGKNGKYGTSGSQWTSQTATSVYPQGSDGADDMANFHGAMLGAKQ